METSRVQAHILLSLKASSSAPSTHRKKAVDIPIELLREWHLISTQVVQRNDLLLVGSNFTSDTISTDAILASPNKAGGAAAQTMALA